VITYNYTNNRVREVKDGTSFIASGIGYYPFGPMKEITYGNILHGAMQYDQQYRLTSLATGTIQGLTYGHDYNGNITGIAPGRTYTYDTLDRLSTASGPWGSLTWTYDGVGNRLMENSTSYTYQPNTNRLNTVGVISYGFDNNGNTTAEGARQFDYNQNQRLIRVVDSGVTKGEYTYNGNGQRVKKIVSGVTTIFHYSLYGQIIAESNSAGQITAEYVYLNGQPLAKIEGADTYYYHNDHLGTPPEDDRLDRHCRMGCRLQTLR